MHSVGFKPVASPDARLLILGSLPGAMSLEKQQYYGLPRNSFWRIMGELVGATPELPYEERLEKLTDHGIALWDVLMAADRPGSLDSAIDPLTLQVNDFAGFLRDHPHIKRICFNGGTAARLFAQKVAPALPPEMQAIPRVTLPSTSPAHAGRSFEEKLRLWREALEGAQYTCLLQAPP